MVNQPVNGATSEASTRGPKCCPVCLGVPQAGRRYCGGACRLRAWAIRELERAIETEEADGLKDAICHLAELCVSDGQGDPE